MKSEIKYIHENGDEQYLTHLSSEELREIGKEDIASLFIPRTELDPDDVDEGFDRAELRVGGDVWFAGVVEEVVRNDDQKEVIVESPERLAERAEPTASVNEYNNVSDAEIVRDAIADVPELSPGAIETTSPATSLLFSHSSQALKMRKAADVSPGILRFNPDYTVDYGRLGRNKSHRTLSPRRDNVSEDFEVDRVSGYENVTHLRMLGAGEGAHQIETEVVSPDYEPGETQIWKTYADKSITDRDTLNNKAEHYVQEMSTRLLDVELTVKGLRVVVGDRFRVYIPTEDVNEILEVVEHKRIVNTDGIQHEATLSNHRDTREDPEEKNRADLGHYNNAVEGNTVPINTSGGRQPVNPDNNYELQLYYPSEVEYEHRLNVRVVGLPYRAYSSGAVDNADFESALSNSFGRETTQIHEGGWTPLVDGEFGDEFGTSTLYAWINVMSRAEDRPEGLRIALRYSKNGGQTYHPSSDGHEIDIREDGEVSCLMIDPTDVAEGRASIEAQVTYASASGSVSTDITHNVMFSAAGKHTHDPDPGIIEEFGDETAQTTYYPTDCSVLVNGNRVGDPIEGDQNHRWTESVDVRGELEQGQVNTIEVESQTLGHAMVFVEGDLFRIVRGRG